MAGGWLEIQVELECETRPGRIMLVGPSHSFAEFAEAIDAAFARWDLSHMHGFELADGRMIGYPDPDFDEPPWLDHEQLKVASEVRPGDEFTYTFDFGAGWTHDCRVLPDRVDPADEDGWVPPRPVPMFGWGSIPDQYLRDTPD